MRKKKNCLKSKWMIRLTSLKKSKNLFKNLKKKWKKKGSRTRLNAKKKWKTE